MKFACVACTRPATGAQTPIRPLQVGPSEIQSLARSIYSDKTFQCLVLFTRRLPTCPHSSSSAIADGMRRIGELYHFWLHEAPLLTKVVTAATLFGTGDRIAQRLESKTKTSVFGELSTQHAPQGHKLVSDSTARTLRMMVWGGLFAAPIMHTWFHVIERVIPGTGKLVVAKKVAADIMIIAPGTSLAFFTVTKRMEGEPLHESFQVAKAKLPPTLLADYMLWPAANAVIFGLVPLHYRTPFTHCVSLV